MPASSTKSGFHTPHGNTTNSNNPASLNYFSYPVSHVVSGLYRRFTDNSSASKSSSGRNMNNTISNNTSTSPEVFTPVRTASPFQPPPLTPLTLTVSVDLRSEPGPDSLQQQLLTRALAEEIRLLVPARLQLVDTWRLAYSLDRDGASLGTLYAKCRDVASRSPRAGFVLVVRDASPNGAVFGAYMTDPPHPDNHYYGTGECFLWRASVLPPPGSMGLQDVSGAGGENPPSEDLLELAGLPPPPSADTTNAGRSTTLRGEPKQKLRQDSFDTSNNRLAPPRSQTQTPTGSIRSGTSTPERIRFKAFPYSGVNDYMMFCETGFLSLGGG